MPSYLCNGLPLDSHSASWRNVQVVLHFQKAADFLGTRFRVLSEFDDAGIANCHERMENCCNEAIDVSIPTRQVDSMLDRRASNWVME